MKRNHNYSSSDSDLDDNVEVEKDSADENGYVSFDIFYIYIIYLRHLVIGFNVIIFDLSLVAVEPRRPTYCDLFCSNNIVMTALNFSHLDSHGSMSPSTTTQVQARKRRRGVYKLLTFARY